MAKLMPEDWEPTSYAGRSSAHGELVEAADLARQHPGRWVAVGEPRALTKPPSSWLSEVNLGKKDYLNRPGERWEAKAEDTGDREGNKMVYEKFIRLVKD